MPSKNYYRFGCFAHQNNVPAIDALCTQAGVSRGSMLEVLVLGFQHPQSPVGQEQLQAVLKLGKALRDESFHDGRKTRGGMIGKLKKLSNEDLERLVNTLEEKKD